MHNNNLGRLVALGLLAVVPVVAQAQETHTLYASGQYPAGNIYRERDLPRLVGVSFTDPSYLIGEYIYLGSFNGAETFATFDVNSPGQLTVGKTLIVVKFFNNFPPNLVKGKVIEPTAADPLILRGVGLSPQGNVIVTAECWSTP